MALGDAPLPERGAVKSARELLFLLQVDYKSVCYFGWITLIFHQSSFRCGIAGLRESTRGACWAQCGDREQGDHKARHRDTIE